MIILGDVHANDDDSQSNITSAEAKDDRSQGSQEHLSAPNPVEVLFACRSVRPGKRGGSEGSGEGVTQSYRAGIIVRSFVRLFWPVI